MKTKKLIILLVVTSIVLFYSMLCYNVLNKRLEIETKEEIINYFNKNYPFITEYEYVKAISDEENDFQVFVKTDHEDFTFHFLIQNHRYLLNDVTVGIPPYI